MSTPATQPTTPPLPGVIAASVYTAADIEKAEAIKAWLARNEKSRSWLAKKAGMPSGTLSQVLGGKYASSPTKQLAQLESVLDVETERMADGTPGYVKGSVHKLMEVVFERTRKHQNFGIVTGYVGVGKTRFAREYCATHPMTVMVDCTPNMTPGVLLTELLEQLNHAVPPGLDRKLREVLKVLRGTNWLLIVDEAERLSPMALEYVRRIRDLAGIGVVLTGTEKLSALIKVQHGQFDQVRSRVGMWPKTIEGITRDDADDMARLALAEAGELPDDVLEALWSYGAGSARVLIENLVPAIRDYGMGRAPLTGELVQRIAEKVLFMTRGRVEGGK